MVKIALARCLSYFVISSNAFLPIGLEIKPLLRFLPNLVHWFFKIYSILHAIQRFAADRHRVQTIAPIPSKFATLLLYLNISRQFIGIVEFLKNSHFLHF